MSIPNSVFLFLWQLNRTPLIYACERGNEEVVKVLLEHWSNYTVSDSDGTSPLSAATGIGNVKILEYVLYLDNFNPKYLTFSVCSIRATARLNN